MTQVAIWPIQKAKLQSRGDERGACDSKPAVVAWMRLDGERSGNSCKGVRLSARPWLEELDCRLSMVDFPVPQCFPQGHPKAISWCNSGS